MVLIRFISSWLCIWMFVLSGCAPGKYARNAGAEMPSQALAQGKESYVEEDPFEKDSPTVECFENAQAIKKAYGRLEKARDSFLAALSLPSFSFYILKNSKTGEEKMVFAENHRLPTPFDDEKEWQAIKESPAEIKTIVICALMLELQKF